MAATWPAWFVHAYTATGAVLAFLAAQAATARNFRAAFLWLFVAVLVDATDGMLARRARVLERVPNFSGQKLDDIVDYLTFVFVPALIVWQADIVTGAWTIAINREHVKRLTAAGRMKPPGQQQVDAAKADGRWGAA